MFIKVLKIVYSNIVHLYIDSISFTQVPSTFKGLFRQRKRWARGMIEAFKKVPVLTSKQMNWKFRILMLFNVLFPFVDLVLLIFVPVGLLFLIFGNQLLVGWLTLFVVLLGLILCLVIEVRRCNALRQVECKLERRSFFAFFLRFTLRIHTCSSLYHWILFRTFQCSEKVVGCRFFSIYMIG